MKTERKLQALEKDYSSQAKKLEDHEANFNRTVTILINEGEAREKRIQQLEKESLSKTEYLDYLATQVENRFNKMEQRLNKNNPQPHGAWVNNPNNVFGHPPQNPSFTAWHSPTRSSGMSNFDSPVPPDQSPFKGWGRSDQSAFVHPGNVPPAPTIKPGDLPPYPGAVVKPEDLCICNEVVTCCIGPNGELYRLTKDTIIAHTVPWEELSPVAFNKVDWRSDNTQWGIFKESAGEDLPKGTLVYSKSNRSTGLIVRYPDRKYNFEIVKL